MRIYLNRDRLDRLTQTLSKRELNVLRTLSTVRLATGMQLHRLHFTDASDRFRQLLLESMTDRRLISRLDRVIGGRRAGSSGYLFALDVAGRRVLERVGGSAVRRPTTPGSPFIRHTLLISELYVALVEAKWRGETELLEFQAEPACWRRYPSMGGGASTLKPDAFVRLGDGEFVDSWWLEVDQGTESPSTLTRKADAVRSYWQTGIEEARSGVFPRTLWLVPDERRYQVVADICAHQPADAWRLHMVTLYSDAVGLMTGGQP